MKQGPKRPLLGDHQFAKFDEIAVRRNPFVLLARMFDPIFKLARFPPEARR
jgi:hypothetical protein